jgi:hypothetical protein
VRASRSVLREAGGEIPPAYSTDTCRPSPGLCAKVAFPKTFRSSFPIRLAVDLGYDLHSPPEWTSPAGQFCAGTAPCNEWRVATRSSQQEEAGTFGNNSQLWADSLLEAEQGNSRTRHDPGKRFEVAGFESRGDLAFIVSDLDRKNNLQIAENFAPMVAGFLNSMNG